MIDLISPEWIRGVLAAWNITPDHVSSISAKANLHWRVQSGRDAFVLRMYNGARTIAAIQYELDILSYLHDRRWQVAAPIGAVVEHSSMRFALFPLIPGNPCERETELQSRRRGRILARLHLDLAPCSGRRQREGWQRIDEVVQFRESACDQNCMLSTTRADLVSAIRKHFESVRNRLYAADASQFPTTINHGDLIAQNLLFEHALLSGVLDFDSAHLDLRAADVACARRSQNDDMVRGYMDVIPLSNAELDSLPDLWRASVLRYALQLLGEAVTPATTPELEWCVRQLEKTRPLRR